MGNFSSLTDEIDDQFTWTVSILVYARNGLILVLSHMCETRFITTRDEIAAQKMYYILYTSATRAAHPLLMLKNAYFYYNIMRSARLQKVHCAHTYA